MHSSGMRTAGFSGRLLLGLESAHGVSAVGCLPWGVCRGGVCRGGVYLRGFDCTGVCWSSGGVWPGGLLGGVSAGRGVSATPPPETLNLPFRNSSCN